MSHFKLVQRCRPKGSYRLEETVGFLLMLRESFQLSSYEVPGKGAIGVNGEDLESLFTSVAARSPSPRSGVDVDLYARRAESGDYLRIEMHWGTAPGEIFVDHLNVDFGDGGLYPSEDRFRQGITLLKPFEAFLAELDNEEELDSYGCQQRIAGFSAPAIIRWLHYFDDDLASRLGGLARCLTAPAAKVEEFLDGVLVRLVSEPFDPRNPIHVKRQKEVMAYLGLPCASAVQAGEP